MYEKAYTIPQYTKPNGHFCSYSTKVVVLCLDPPTCVKRICCFECHSLRNLKAPIRWHNTQCIGKKISKKKKKIINCVYLQGFPNDSCTFVWWNKQHESRIEKRCLTRCVNFTLYNELSENIESCISNTIIYTFMFAPFDKKRSSEHQTVFPLWDGLWMILINSASHIATPYAECSCYIQPDSTNFRAVWRGDITFMQKLKVRHLLGSSFHIFRTFSFHYRVVAISRLEQIWLT